MNRLADQCQMKKLCKRAVESLHYWREWWKAKERIRKLWMREGLERLHKAIEQCKSYPLHIWIGWVTYKRLVKERLVTFTPIMRKLWLSHIEPHR